MHKWRSWVGILVFLGGCGAEPGASAPLAETEAAIVGGATAVFNPFVVAVYHRDNQVWSERPCTGMVFGPLSDPNAHVVTAYHCVNETSSLEDLRMTTSLNPGRLINAPPAGWLQPTHLSLPQNPVVAGETDYATLTVSSSVRSGITRPNLVTQRPALFMGSTQDMVGWNLTAFGYGRNTFCSAINGPTCDIEDPNSGVGVLRTASFFTILSGGVPGNRYIFNGATQGGASINHGDSGGPSLYDASFTDLAGASHPWRILAGVHSTPSAEVAAPGVPELMEAEIGWLWLSSFMNPAGHVASSFFFGGDVLKGNLTNPALGHWTYAWHQALQTPEGLCVQGSSTVGASVRLAACDGSSNQRWVHTKSFGLKNVGTGKCLQYGAGGFIEHANCATRAEQAWVFRTDADQN